MDAFVIAVVLLVAVVIVVKRNSKKKGVSASQYVGGVLSKVGGKLNKP